MPLNFLNEDNNDDYTPKPVPRPEGISLSELMGNGDFDPNDDAQIRERYGDEALDAIKRIEDTAVTLTNYFMSILTKQTEQDPSLVMDLFMASETIKQLVRDWKPEDVMALLAHMANRHAQLLLMVTDDDEDDGDEN